MGNVLRLQTLGGAVLFDPSGRALDSPVATRRTLALLAVLASAGERGVSRDQLVALFWPDNDLERARHSLTQALYVARRALRAEELFLGTADLRLNPELITTDVGEFETAIAADDFHRAALLYRGSFLDGFFLSGATMDFEQWMAAHRTRYDDQAARVLELLARRAESLGDRGSAVDAWRRLAALRPLDSRVSVEFMKALASEGNRAGALLVARTHELLLREELDIEPDQAFRDLARALAENDASVGESQTRGAPPAASGDPSPSGSGRDAVATSPPGPRSPTRAPMLRARHWIMPAVGVLVLATTATWFSRSNSPDTQGDVPQVRQRLVVAPFRVAGASGSVEYLRMGAVELLAPRLSDYAYEQAIDRGAMLGAWRQAGLNRDASVPRHRIVSLATRMGAERVVLGSVVGSEQQLIVDAHMLALPSGETVASATARGSVDSIAPLMDRLASRLLLAEARQTDRFGGRLPRNSAVRAYVAAEAAARRSAYRAARTAYADALRDDSTFALAGLRLAVLADRMHDVATARRGVAVAWRSRDQLNAGDRAVLVAFAGPRYPTPSTDVEQLAAWRSPTRSERTDASSWVSFASRVFHDGGTVNLASWPDTVRSALRRALELNPDDKAAAQLLLQLPADSLTRTLQASAAEDSLDPVAAFLRWRNAVLARDTAALSGWRDSFGRLRLATLRLIAMAGQYDVRRRGDVEAAIRVWMSRANDPVDHDDAVMALHSLLLNEAAGRIAIDRMARFRSSGDDARDALLRMRVLDGLYGAIDEGIGGRAAQELERRTALSEDPVTRRQAATRAANQCVVGQWRLAQGDTTDVDAVIGFLSRQPPPQSAEQLLFAAAPAACAVLLDAWQAVVSRQPDAHDALARTDSLAFTSYIADDAATYAPLLLSRLHARLGDRSAAIRALRRRSYMSGWPRYLATMTREEARLSK